jgi:hypothetical protein
MRYGPNYIDTLNIGLILISLVIAIIVPFELFLFSYAFLGPLHYLTEITWLREKKFFVAAHQNWVLILVVIAVLISIYPIIAFGNFINHALFNKVVNFLGNQYNLLLLISFLFAVSLIFFKNSKKLVISLLLICLLSGALVYYIPKLFLVLGIFLPTLIHVYIFTMFFIFYGAIKSKSSTGIYVGFLLITVPFILYVLPASVITYQPSIELTKNYGSSNMFRISDVITRILEKMEFVSVDQLTIVALKIQIFIAFAYTYHYLNWFSKTNLIGWGKAISKKRMIIVAFLWILSISIYLYDYKTGFITLFRGVNLNTYL